MKLFIEHDGRRKIFEDIPASPELVLRPILQQEGDAQGLLTLESLQGLSLPASCDADFNVVGKLGDCEVVTDGVEVARVVLEGLRRRLVLPVQPGEKLRVR